jgi:hypothetical protein
MGQSHEIFCFCFFYESVSPQPQSIPLGPFQFFSKICGDIHKSRCTTAFKDPFGKFATSANDTGSKIAAFINETGGKFATSFASVVDTSGKFATVSTIWAANLPPCLRCQWQIATGINDTGGEFATGVNTPVANNGNNYQTADNLK